MTVVVEHPPGREPERRYAAEVLLGSLLGLPWRCVAAERDDVLLRLEGADGELSLRDGLLGCDDWLEPASLPHRPFAHLPLLWEDDFFGTVFFLVTRYEELVLAARDPRGRFGRAQSILAEHVHRPLADEAADLLGAALRARWPRLELPRREPRVLPSHDVDWPRSPEQGIVSAVRRAAGDALRRDPGQSAARLAAVARGRDPNDTFDLIMRLSEERGLRSAFYFIAGGSPPLDGDYRLDDPWLRDLLRRIHARGHEIGLHGSYETMLDAERLAAEAGTLRRVCAEEGIEQERWGGRQHYLRWRNPETWRAWDEAGLDYDSSVGFHDDVGFRCGTSRPFPVFDLVHGRRLRLEEQPLVAMEVALLDNAGVGPGDTAARLRGVKAECTRYGGAFTLLWHNSRLVAPREQRLYREALDA